MFGAPPAVFGASPARAGPSAEVDVGVALNPESSPFMYLSYPDRLN